MFDPIRFLWALPASDVVYQGQYHLGLVTLSLVIAVASSLGAMSAASRITAVPTAGAKWLWVFVGAVTMGLGTWAMHFIGMLSLSLPCGVYYDPTATLLSMLPGVVSSALALWLVNGRRVRHRHVVLASVLLGGGIGAMHYSGMAAMRLEGFITYNPYLFLFSIFVAVLLAYVALRVKVSARCTTWRCTAVVALFMGAAVSGMHYTAMSAAYFMRGPTAGLPPTVMESESLALVITVVTALLAIVALALAAMSRTQDIARKLQESEQRWRFALEGSGDGVWDLNLQTGVAELSSAAKEMFGFAESELANHVSQWHARVHPEDQFRVNQEFLTFLRSGAKQYRSEYRVRTRAQRWCWILAEGMAVSWTANGRIVRLIGTARDVTQRKLAQQRDRRHSLVFGLLAAKAPMAQMLDCIADGLHEADPSHRCAIFLLDEDSKQLRVASAPHLRGESGQKLTQGMLALAVSGVAAFKGERVVATADGCAQSDAGLQPWMLQAGYQAFWSQPILSASGQVLGALDIYSTDPVIPNRVEMQALEEEARLVALVVEKTKAEARLQLAASVFTHAREGIMITDAAGNIMEINDTFTRITGYGRADVVGKNPRLLQSGRHSPEFYAEMWSSLLQQDQWSGEIWNRRKNGEVFADMRTISTVRDGAGNVQNFVALFTDITPLKEHQQQLEHIAHYDALTNLPNRVLLADRLQQAMSQTGRSQLSLAVVYLDLDGFKAVNDLYGHGVGDELLVVVSRRMKAALREGDTLARMGGDEFVAVLLDLNSPQDCEPVLERLLRSASEPVPVGDLVVNVSASIGVTMYPQDEADADQLMRHADQAMYQAKQSGKNRYHVFDVDQDAAMHAQHERLEEFRLALRRREFVLHYQPKVNMRSGEVLGFEALIRWQHPQRGLLSPAEFLPVVEGSEVMVEVGHYVVEEALTQMEAWLAQGQTWPVAVNIAARHLMVGDFCGWLSSVLQRHAKVPHGYLELEIVETAAIDDVQHVAELIRLCHEMGVAFAIDDFGTGYSSLTYLKSLPADKLKIDRSFVRDMLDDSSDMAMVHGVISLASVFDRGVIAEGVEQSEQGVLLMRMGCEVAQGFGIARPMPAHEVPQWVARFAPDVSWAHWARHAWNLDDFPLLVAQHDHDRWVAQALLALKGVAPGQQDIHAAHHAACRFGQWYYGIGAARYGHLAEYTDVGQGHEQLHDAVTELIGFLAQGQLQAAQTGADTVMAVKAQWFGQLEALQVQCMTASARND